MTLARVSRSPDLPAGTAHTAHSEHSRRSEDEHSESEPRTDRARRPLEPRTPGGRRRCCARFAYVPCAVLPALCAQPAAWPKQLDQRILSRVRGVRGVRGSQAIPALWQIAASDNMTGLSAPGARTRSPANLPGCHVLLEALPPGPRTGRQGGNTMTGTGSAKTKALDAWTELNERQFPIK